MIGGFLFIYFFNFGLKKQHFLNPIIYFELYIFRKILFVGLSFHRFEFDSSTLRILVPIPNFSSPLKSGEPENSILSLPLSVFSISHSCLCRHPARCFLADLFPQSENPCFPESTTMDLPADRPPPNHARSFKSRPSAIYLSSIVVLCLAILFFSFTKTDYYKAHSSKFILSSHRTLLQKLIGLLNPPRNSKQTSAPSPLSPPSRCVFWMAPFLSGGGYSSEAWSYILALHEHIKTPEFRLAIDQHGDLESIDFWEGLPDSMRTLAIELHQSKCRMNETIVICHSEPGAWNPPLFETLPCPPGAYQNFKSVIGRTMFETDRVNQEHVKRCNRMDYVWVPSEFHVSTFRKSGVDPSKIVKIVQPIDVNFFDPLKYRPLSLASVETLVLGAKNMDISLEKRFVFLSIFKWEYRKGWDLLLEAYLKEFSDKDKVGLHLLTNPYHTDNDFGNKIYDFVENSEIQKPVAGWAPVYVVDTHIAQTDLPRVYKAADAFVLPSRGEGWGRPLVEAMAMSLPVIATNWSGQTEYLTDENSYPLPVERMSEVMEGPFEGHLWAEPSVSKLQALMRKVTTNVDEAKAKGRRAREDMVTRFSPDVVADIVHRQIESIFHNKR